MKKKDNAKNNKGFTLIELIIVVAIMAVLTSLITSSLIRYVQKARKARDRYTAAQIASAYKAAVTWNDSMWGYMIDWADSSYRQFHKNLSVTRNGVTETYVGSLVVASEKTYFTGTQREYVTSGFYHHLNAALGLKEIDGANKSMIPKYKTKRSGPHPEDGVGGVRRTLQTVDRWRIVERVDNGNIEVWSADGTRMGGWPQFRVWPDCDDEYR